MNPQAITGIFGCMPLFKGSQLLTLQMKRDGTFNEIEQFKIEDGEESAYINIQCSNGMATSCLFDWARVERITPGLIGGL